MLRRFINYLPANNRVPPPHRPTPDKADRVEPSLDTLVPDSPTKPYDMKELVLKIVDDTDFFEIQPEHAKNIVVGFARMEGYPVGIVANQKLHIRESGKPFQVGGVIYPESADKAARFIMDCNQSHVPILFFHDVNGFMVGREAEIAGIIKSGAKLVNVVANSVVPKITVLIGGSYGAGHYALCGKAYDPRLVLAWPTCRYAVMGGEQAAKTLLDLKLRQLQRQKKQIDHSCFSSLLYIDPGWSRHHPIPWIYGIHTHQGRAEIIQRHFRRSLFEGAGTGR